MGQVIVVASGKGGTGKTTTTACVSSALSKLGKKVLCVDFDFGLRNLDLALFIDDKVVFDIADVINCVCSFEKAVISHPKYENLWFLAAPQDESKINFEKDKTAELIKSLKDQFDFIIIDAPASLGRAFYYSISGADRALLVTTPELYALRDAQKIAGILEEFNIPDSRLVINKLRVKHIDKGYSKNIDEVIDMICLPLIGVVPYDENIVTYTNSGMDIMQNEKTLAAQAYKNIAKRICGKSVPLMKIKKGLFR